MTLRAMTDAAGRAIWYAKAEILTAGALLGGWLLITAAIASLTDPIAWLFSLGFLLLSLGGWQMAYRIASHGLYVLTRKQAKRG